MSGPKNNENVALVLFKQGWFQVGLGGIVLFIIVDLILKSTRSPDFLPAFIMLGAFTVPVAFAAYFFRQEHLLDRSIHGGISIVRASVMFLGGGIVGTIIAGILATPLNFSSTLLNSLSVSAIEEAAKLVLPIVVFLQARYRSEADGVMFGIATGMGFAALETIGYVLIALMSLSDGVNGLEHILVVRGLLLSFGQAAWTGLICGALWHYRGQGRKLVLLTLGYFLLAVILHTLWELAGNTDQNLIMYPSYVAIGALSLFLVLRHLHHVRQKTNVES